MNRQSMNIGEMLVSGEVDISSIQMYALLNCIRPLEGGNMDDFMFRKITAVQDLETVLYPELPDNWNKIVKKIDEEARRKAIEHGDKRMHNFYFSQLKLRELVKILYDKVPKKEMIEF